MTPTNANGPGDGSGPKKKRAPSARKRAPKTVKAAEQGAAPVVEREAEVGVPPQPQDQADGTERSRKEVVSKEAVSTPRAADQGDPGDDGQFGETQADRAAELANDLKSWMDTRREDRDRPREVL